MTIEVCGLDATPRPVCSVMWLAEITLFPSLSSTRMGNENFIRARLQTQFYSSLSNCPHSLPWCLWPSWSPVRQVDRSSSNRSSQFMGAAPFSLQGLGPSTLCSTGCSGSSCGTGHVHLCSLRSVRITAVLAALYNVDPCCLLITADIYKVILCICSCNIESFITLPH